MCVIVFLKSPLGKWSEVEFDEVHLGLVKRNEELNYLILRANAHFLNSPEPD